MKEFKGNSLMIRGKYYAYVDPKKQPDAYPDLPPNMSPGPPRRFRSNYPGLLTKLDLSLN